MKATTVLRCGLALLVAAIFVRWYADSWSLVQIDPQMTSSTTPVYTVNVERKDVFVAASEGLALLGIIFTSIAVFRLTDRP
jgi:hypothetical protein